MLDLLPQEDRLEEDLWSKAELREALRRLIPREDPREEALLRRREVLRREAPFLEKHLPQLEAYLAEPEEVDPLGVEPELVLVNPKGPLAHLPKLFSLVWWSMPYASPYGRRFTYLIRDRQNGKYMGLVSLMSPVIRMNVRDQYLGLTRETVEVGVNLGLQGHRVGALPPYHRLLGGKLSALVLASREVRLDYQARYQGRTTLLKKRTIPPWLLYVVVTGAYGKAPIYEGLRYQGALSRMVGFTQGYGTAHIPEEVHRQVVAFLARKGVISPRGTLGRLKGYGAGPSQKLYDTGKACKLLGLPDITLHGHPRGVYVFPHAANLQEVIQKVAMGEEVEPLWRDHPFSELAAYWKERFLKKGLPRWEEGASTVRPLVEEASRALEER